MSQELTTITQEVSPILTRGETMEITSPEEMTEATTILSQANKALDRIKDEKEKVLAPLREAANAEKARWEPLESRFKPVVARLRDLISKYQTAALAKKKEDDDKIAARVKEGKGNFTPETAIRKMEKNTVEEKVVTEAGGLSFREKKVLKIVDESKIPDEFWIIDEAKVLANLKEGIAVPGAEIEIVQVPVNKR